MRKNSVYLGTGATKYFKKKKKNLSASMASILHLELLCFRLAATSIAGIAGAPPPPLLLFESCLIGRRRRRRAGRLSVTDLAEAEVNAAK